MPSTPSDSPYSLPPATDPLLNVRVFAADNQASLAAAERWAGTPLERSGLHFHLLVEDVAPESLRELHSKTQRPALQRAPGARCWLAGLDWPRIGQLITRSMKLDPKLGDEIGLAVSAYEKALAPRTRTQVLGILNVTPDSFSDGGRWLDPSAAVEHGLRLVEEGAEILDIGGESTRPGAAEVPAEEELRRVLPVLQRLRPQTRAVLSIDTRKASVARACLEAGADWINDVSGLTFDPLLADVVAEHPEAKLVLMHSRSKPAQEQYSTEWDEQGKPVYEDVVADTMRWLRRQIQVAIRAGVKPENLWIDPGFGFGKTYEQNVELLRRLREYTSIGAPVLVGTSRKSSVGRMAGGLPPEERLEATAATVAWAAANGAAAVRVHDVREMVRIVRVTHELMGI